MATTTTRFALSKPASGDNVSSFQSTIGTTLDTVDLNMIGLQGAYAGGTAYHAGDVVTSGGFYYMSTTTQTGAAPPGATWVRLGLPSRVFANVGQNESTASASYVDLATPGPAVAFTVPANGKALLTVGCASYASGTGYGYIGFALSGANTAANADLLYCAAGAANVLGSYATRTLLSGLTAGATTFTLQYKSSGPTVNFFSRSVLVEEWIG